jgi:hypothetical protein
MATGNLLSAEDSAGGGNSFQHTLNSLYPEIQLETLNIIFLLHYTQQRVKLSEKLMLRLCQSVASTQKQGNFK